MPSRVLYPPIVDSAMPAFSGNSCRIYFRLSKFNNDGDFKRVHISIHDQKTNMNMVNIKKYETGIILDVEPILVANDNYGNLYYVDVKYKEEVTDTIPFLKRNWVAGSTYKVQLRLANSIYAGSGLSQNAFLNNESDSFSEWSTVCIIKAIGQINYKIPIFNLNTGKAGFTMSKFLQNPAPILQTTTLILSGNFNMGKSKEFIKYYRFILYDNLDKVLEDTKEIYSNQYQNNNNFNYIMKTQLENDKIYKIAFIFETNNQFVGGFYLNKENNKDERLTFSCSNILLDYPPCRLLTVENDIYGALTNLTNLFEEEEEGRIGIKIFDPLNRLFSGNLCIRRTDSKSNFKIWEDIHLVGVKSKNINDLPIFFDYTIESGVWYNYGIQIISENDRSRGLLDDLPNPIMRNFNYSFLLGENGKQLKLKFDNTMPTFKYQVAENKVDPIGSKFVNVARNAATYYRTFPLNGLISFAMDENKLFCNKKIIYEHENIVELYEDYNKRNHIDQYDYIYERDFRTQVLNFLQDGKYKLFKSPTEGNIIIRLMDVNCTPNQTLDRMLYSFTSNAFEVDEYNMENCLKYGFYKIGQLIFDFSTTELKLGQLCISNLNCNDNVFSKILYKYTGKISDDSKSFNMAGYNKTIVKIHHLKITFNEKPYQIGSSSILGYSFKLNGSNFVVRSPINIYEVDKEIIFTPNSTLLIGDEKNHPINDVVIDFLYELKVEPYKEKIIVARTRKKQLGQFWKMYSPGEDIYLDLYHKYYVEWNLKYRRFTSLNAIEIETVPGAVFTIQDNTDQNPGIHVVGITGQLRIADVGEITQIHYLGVQNNEGILEPKNESIIINYSFILEEGDYKNENS